MPWRWLGICQLLLLHKHCQHGSQSQEEFMPTSYCRRFLHTVQGAPVGFPQEVADEVKAVIIVPQVRTNKTWVSSLRRPICNCLTSQGNMHINTYVRSWLLHKSSPLLASTRFLKHSHLNYALYSHCHSPLTFILPFTNKWRTSLSWDGIAGCLED